MVEICACRFRVRQQAGLFRLPATPCVRSNETSAEEAKPQVAAPKLAKPRFAGDTSSGNHGIPLPLLQEQAHRATRPEATAEGSANEAQARLRSRHHAGSNPSEGDRVQGNRLSMHAL